MTATAMSWAFLWQPAGFDIGETSLLSYDASKPLWLALVVGVFNTLRVAVPAIGMALCLGAGLAILGRGRSPLAWTVRTLGMGLRQTPLLLQLLLLYTMLVEWLPDSDQALSLPLGACLSKSGLAIPWLEPGPAGWHWAWPQMGRFGVESSANLSPEYLCVWLGLSLYGAAFMAETFRSGFSAVPPSWAEAAQTLGASRWAMWRRVLVPAGIRAILPALVSQCLNVLKNSTLAVVVGYPDLISVSNTAMNQSGQATQCVLLVMLLFGAMSGATSWLLQALQRRWPTVAMST